VADGLHLTEGHRLELLYLSTILDDYSRYIIALRLCTTMNVDDVTDTLELALQATGCGQANVIHKLRLLSDNGASLSREPEQSHTGRRLFRAWSDHSTATRMDQTKDTLNQALATP